MRMLNPEDPAEVAAAVADIIRLQPDRHDQTVWFDSRPGIDEDQPGYPHELPVEEIIASIYGDGECTSTACVAGWAAILTAPAGTVVTDGCWLLKDVTLAGQRALGLTRDDAAWLFDYGRDREQVLAALDSLAKGEKMTMTRL